MFNLMISLNCVNAYESIYIVFSMLLKKDIVSNILSKTFHDF